MTTKENTTEIAKQMNNTVLSVLGQKNLLGFEKAYVIADAIMKLSEQLTPEYMKPIMAMQGNRLGFKTDKDKTGGYPETVVKNCLIEAVLLGLQPYGNQFNIIAGNMYPTKEGCGFLLDNYEGLTYNLICGLPKITGDSAAIDVSIEWSLNGNRQSKVVPIPLKKDAYTSVDGLVGKATRKGRAWLLSNITGVEITDGDITDHVEITVEEKKEAIRESKSEKPTLL